MRSLPPQVEREILKRALEGATYREIGDEFGVSTATVNRIFDDARKRMSDVDSLRELSILLRKAGWTVFDATKSCRLMEALNKWGISLDELDGYVRLNERLLSERALDENFLFYALKLMQLEETSERTYQEVVENYEMKLRETAEAEERKLALDTECVKVKAELSEATVKLVEVKSEIETATTTRKGLTGIGLNRLAQLVKFIQDFEAMGYDANQAKRLALWRRQLQELHIDPDELDKFIAEKGSLEAQNNSLRLAIERIEAEVTAQATEKVTLVAGNSVLQAVDRVLTARAFTMPCKSCGYPQPIALPTRESLRDLLCTGKAFTVRCRNCGVQQSFSAWDIALQIAWTVLPTDTVTI